MKKIFYYFIIFSSLSLIIAYLPIGKCSSITTEDAYLEDTKNINRISARSNDIRM